MKKLSLWTIGVLMYVTFVIVACNWAHSAEPIEEQVIKLPQDADKWFISIVGVKGERQYEDMLKWFSADANLVALRKQVHYWVVPTNGEAYKERYKKNTKLLPMIRVQEADGDVVYERGGGAIPSTAGDLYREVSRSSAQAISWRWRDREPLLPWRYNNRKCPDNNCPTPEPAPLPVIPLDPEPDPLDDGGPPVFEEEESASSWVAIVSAIASALGGAGLGLAQQWKKVTGAE